MTFIQKEHVPSGNFSVSRAKPVTLQAFLGSCVGVSIYDHSHKIGGLFHILLPEPVSDTPPPNPEKYASTGIPLFINELCEAGALKENMTATIAGGALVGPASEQDISLDIGGRTAEIAQQIFKSQGIKVKESETGGFFTCVLNLDLSSGETRITPSTDKPIEDGFKFTPPTASDIKQTMKLLQPIPQVALKILRLTSDNSADIKEIAAEVLKDQVISAKTLQICNSALFSGRVKIESINDALLLMGQDLLIQLVISASVHSFYSQSDSGYSLCKGGIYHHATGTALIAQKIAGITDISPSTAYAAGLMHDIGKVVLDQYITSACPLFYRRLKKEGETSLNVEKKILGINHCEAGYKLALDWKLPPCLSNTTRYHHRPEEAPEDVKLVTVVYLADLLMSRFHSGLELERIDTANLETRLAGIGLTIEQIPEIIDMIPLEIFENLSDH